MQQAVGAMITSGAPSAADAQRSAREVEMSTIRSLLAIEGIWVAWFLGTALCIAVGVGAVVSAGGAGLATAAVAGAAVGVGVARAIGDTGRRLWERHNGAPIIIGDEVRILVGPAKGRIATVYAVWDSRRQVRIHLDEESAASVSDVFSLVQVCRVRPAEPAAAADGPTVRG